MPATADDIGGTGSALQVLTRVTASPNVDTVEWRAVASLLTPDLIAGIYATTWAVTAWFLDKVLGDDNNNGTTALTPLKTGVELQRRLGPYALWPQSVTVTIGPNGLDDGLILTGAMLTPSTHLDVLGTPTVIANDTIGTYAVPVLAGTPTATQITGTAIVDWTAHQWRRIRVTSGAHVGAMAWVATANPAGVGVATARISVPYALNAAAIANAAFAAIALAPGDPFVVETLPVVPSIALHVDGPLTRGNVVTWTARQWSIGDLACPQVVITSPSSSNFNRGWTYGCKLGSYECLGNPNISLDGQQFGTYASFFGYQDAAIFLLGFLYITGFHAGALIGDGVLVAKFIQAVTLSSCLSQGARLLQLSKMAVTWNNTQAFDVAGATIPAFTMTSGSATNLTGAGNAGFGVAIPNSSGVTLAGTINVIGAVSNGRLSTAPAVNLTLPQLLQPDDFAQKGITAAMVAGSVTVTVPWYDNAIQQVTVVHATFGGTPGILSVAQISNTQFTVNSSNALDTGTIRWQISPLGRNIQIATT
jgi:hypothetical protein